MSTPAAAPFQVPCPCCQAALTVDPELRAVIAHAPPPRCGSPGSLDRALETVRGAEARRDTLFRKAAEAERSKGELLTRKFEAGLQRAKDSPDPPRRPFDLD